MSLDPLADYLEPQFGNVHEYNWQSDDTGFAIQPWTPELQTAVTHYLVQEVTAEDWQPFLDELLYDVPDGTRAEQAAFIIAHDEPWVVAHAFHLAALKVVPILGQLIGQLDDWEDASLQEDVGVWLNTHASDEQLVELAAITNHPERNPATPWYNPEPTGWHLAENLTPPTLLDAWHQVVGPAESDLTDDEWRLLGSVLPAPKNRYGSRARSNQELLSLRRAFDGIRYKFDQDIPWTRMPRRYGTPPNPYQRYVNYRDRGDFARLYQALQGQPGAERVQTWLKEVTQEPRRDRRRQ